MKTMYMNAMLYIYTNGDLVVCFVHPIYLNIEQCLW